MPRANRPVRPLTAEKASFRLNLPRRARREIRRIQAAQQAVSALGFTPLTHL